MDASFGRAIGSSFATGLIVLVVATMLFGGCCGGGVVWLASRYSVSVDIKNPE